MVLLVKHSVIFGSAVTTLGDIPHAAPLVLFASCSTRGYQLVPGAFPVNHCGVEQWWSPGSSSVGWGGCTLPVVKRRKIAPGLNLLNAPEAKFLTCTALFMDHSWESRENSLVYLSCGDSRGVPPDFTAIAGSLRLCADFSGEAPTWRTLGSRKAVRHDLPPCV